MHGIDCEKNYYTFFYKLLILMKGLTSVALSATKMSHILNTIYMKQKQKETILSWWLWKQCIQIRENFGPYDIAGTLDKQYVLAGYNSFVKFGQLKIVF